MVKVDLTKKPYFLEKEDIQWVEDTIAGMTTEEKIGQLFVNMGSERSEEYLKDVLEKYHIGAVRYNPGTSKEVHEQNRILQENAKIPLLIAANTEAGGNGACTDGTEIGVEVKIGATKDPKYAYEMGRVSGIEAAGTWMQLVFCTDHRYQPQLEKSDHFLEKFWFRPGYGIRNVQSLYERFYGK